MLEKVRQFILDQRLLDRGERVLVGVSGGPDSVALLDALVALQPEFDWTLHVVHFNHQLRGEASDEDEAFVCHLAEAFDLPVSVGSDDVRAWAEDHRLSIEDAARRLRHAFFQDVADETGMKKLALGHNADDQVETLLQRLLRGAGTRGLSAMRPSNHLGNLTMVRPLLDVWKTEILEDARKRGLKFREDASNLDTQFQRNKIRHQLLPLLARDYNPSLKTVLHQTAAILAAEDEWMEAEAARLLSQCRPEPHTVLLAPLRRAHRAVQRRAIYQWLLEHGSPEKPVGVDFRTVEVLCRMAATGNPGQLQLTAGLNVARLEDRLELVTVSAAADATLPADFAQRIQIPGVTRLAPLGLVVEAAIATGDEVPPPGRRAAGHDLPAFGSKFPIEFEEWLDADAVGGTMTVRLWQPGDRFQPIGMRASKKLQDIFVDEKVPPAQRRRTPLFVAEDGGICWVFAYRIGERFKLTAATQRGLKLHVRPG